MKIKDFLKKRKKELLLGGVIIAETVLLVSAQKSLSKKEGEIKNLKDTCKGQEKSLKNLAYQLGKLSKNNNNIN